MQQIVLVTGMHRSGTSMVANMLAVSGFATGEPLLPPVEDDNAGGYWENANGVSINDDILAHWGGTWRNCPLMPDGWHMDASMTPFLERITSFIDGIDGKRIMFKDPRLSLTLPLWLRLFPAAQVVICVRQPAAVAASLAARRIPEHAPSVEEAISLWMRYMASIRRHVGQNALWLTYESFLLDSARTTGRLLDYVGAASYKEALAVFDPSYCHHRFEFRDLLQEVNGRF